MSGLFNDKNDGKINPINVNGDGKMTKDIRQELKDLFIDGKSAVKKFKRTTYEDNINTLFEKYKEVLREVVNEYTESEDKEKFTESIGAVFSSYATDELAPLSKRKRSYHMIDYNMGMVAYVFPVLLKEPSECMESIVAAAVTSWNEAFKESKIARSTQDMIQGGFKKGLCYISTAVCTSLGKGDDCYELNLLRNYRDVYLDNDKGVGREIVRAYYNIAPTIVKRIDKEKNSTQIYAEIWNSYLKKCISLIEENQFEKCKEIYIDMVNKLKTRYF